MLKVVSVSGLFVAVLVGTTLVCAQSQSPRPTGSDPARGPMPADEPVATPTNLRDCYMRVALTKANPDAMYLARELCNTMFKKLDPSSLALYDAKTTKCTEWFFDADGRYETADMYCAFEPRGDNKYAFACEAKDAKVRRFTFAELTKNERRYDKTRTAGYDIGSLFTTMAACVEHKSMLPGVKSE